MIPFFNSEQIQQALPCKALITALRDAFQKYVDLADQLDDGPTVRILRQAIAEAALEHSTPTLPAPDSGLADGHLLDHTSPHHA